MILIIGQICSFRSPIVVNGLFYPTKRQRYTKSTNRGKKLQQQTIFTAPLPLLQGTIKTLFGALKRIYSIQFKKN